MKDLKPWSHTFQLRSVPSDRPSQSQEIRNRPELSPHHTLLMLSSGLVLTWLSRVGCSAHQTDSWPERAVCQWGHLGMRAGAVGSCAQAPDGTESSQAKREAGSEEDLRMANVVRGGHQVQKGQESS